MYPTGTQVQGIYKVPTGLRYKKDTKKVQGIQKVPKGLRYTRGT